MDPVAEIKVISAVCRTIINNVKITLHNIVVPKFFNRQEALQTSIHVAEKRVIFKADHSILELRQSPILPRRWIKLW